MLVEEVSEYSGQLLELRRSVGLKLYAWSTPAIMILRSLQSLNVSR